MALLKNYNNQKWKTRHRCVYFLQSQRAYSEIKRMSVSLLNNILSTRHEHFLTQSIRLCQIDLAEINTLAGSACAYRRNEFTTRFILSFPPAEWADLWDAMSLGKKHCQSGKNTVEFCFSEPQSVQIAKAREYIIALIKIFISPRSDYLILRSFCAFLAEFYKFVCPYDWCMKPT